MKIRVLLPTITLLMFLSAAATAEVPTSIPVQGLLAEADGTPVNGEIEMVVWRKATDSKTASFPLCSAPMKTPLISPSFKPRAPSFLV